MTIIINSEVEIAGIRGACQLAKSLLGHLEEMIKPGVTTLEINDEAERYTQEHGAISAPLGYAPLGLPPFSKSICTSMNNVICHGIPDKEHILTEGDIVNVDVSPTLNGFYGDTSRTFIIGSTSTLKERLVRTTEECLYLGIEAVKPGATTGDIGHAIQTHAEENGFSIVREFTGHGIGRVFHCAPTIRHYGKPGEGVLLREGMIFTIEPMLNSGGPEMKILSDEWTAVTADGSDSAQFEHTVLVTKDGVDILTR